MHDAVAFANEPLAELRRAPQRERLLEALARLDDAGPLAVPVWIGPDRRDADTLRSTDPGNPDHVVARAAVATPAEIDLAVATASAAQRAWGARESSERAQALREAAAWMRARRETLSALCVRECAKPWPEADADVCEAIDFLMFYAGEAIRLQRDEPLLQVPGERNVLHRRPRGVVAVIAPWNFPIAIATGMAAAALATGNAVVFKPAEQAPGCGRMVVEALRAGGVPPEVIALLPGEGDIGAALVAHAGVHVVAFTGSEAVGLEILARAAVPATGQRHLKNVVAEMGGKNCIVVDADADLDDVVGGVLRSAFSYAGQKCSAASRLMVHETIADTLVDRLGGAVRGLLVGDAADFATDVGPLVEAAARDRVDGLREEAAGAGRLLVVGAGPVPTHGHYCLPAIVTDLPADHPLLVTEVFGPLLSVERVADVEQAADRIDALPFALTGGLYARNPRTVERFVRRSPVGNLYVNRAITGAMVARQPFGGNRRSGTGTKAGGADYLLAFTVPLVVTEETVRHGLVM